MSDTVTAVIRGKTSFAKILGAPVYNKFNEANEWKMDLVLTPEGVKEIKALGIGDKVKSKDDYLDGQSYITFKQSEFKKDGTPNLPIKVVDIKDNKWPENQLLGNGTDVDVKFVVMDYGKGKKKGVYIRAVRVLNLVPYEKTEFEPVNEDDEFYANLEQAEAMAAAAREAEDRQFKKDFISDDDLDDEVI